MEIFNLKKLIFEFMNNLNQNKIMNIFSLCNLNPLELSNKIKNKIKLHNNFFVFLYFAF